MAGRVGLFCVSGGGGEDWHYVGRRRGAVLDHTPHLLGGRTPCIPPKSLLRILYYSKTLPVTPPLTFPPFLPPYQVGNLCSLKHTLSPGYQGSSLLGKQEAGVRWYRMFCHACFHCGELSSGFNCLGQFSLGSPDLTVRKRRRHTVTQKIMDGSCLLKKHI